MLFSIGTRPSKSKQLRKEKGISLIESFSDYVVIDLETTGLDPAYDNIIEFAGVRVKDGLIIDRFQSLVYSQYGVDDFITELTGITNEMLSIAPPLDDVLPRFIEFIGNDVVVAHNANFDVNFIYDDCAYVLQHEFRNDFVDTMRVSRRLFKEHSSHTLAAIVERFGIKGSIDHRALSDAEKTYECYEYMKQYAIDNGVEFSTLHPKDVRAKEVATENTEFNETTPIFNKAFVFTGVLEKMIRKEAMQAVVDMGGICFDNVNKKTNYLVLGNNDYCSTIKDGKSSKQKKAESFMLSGLDLQVISENVFYDMLVE